VKETHLCSLREHRLFFSHRGGFGTIIHKNAEAAAQSLSPRIAQPDAVHGVLLRMSEGDFGRLAGMEHQYEAREVTVQTYEGRNVVALAFVSPGSAGMRRVG
jgi:hypothetical protein